MGVWLAAVLDAAFDAIVGHDADGVITSFNGPAERLYGYPEREAVGQPVSMLGSGTGHVRKNGSSFEAVSRAVEVHDGDRGYQGTVTFVRERVAESLEHELNNQLGIILSFATFATEQLPAGSQAHEDVQEVLRAARRAAELVRDWN